MPLTVAALGFIAFQINAATDNRELENLSIDTVRWEIEVGTILTFLRRRIQYMDLTHLTAFLIEGMQRRVRRTA